MSTFQCIADHVCGIYNFLLHGMGGVEVSAWEGKQGVREH